MEGVLMVAPVKMSAFSLPPFVIRKILGIGHGGEYDSMRCTTRKCSTWSAMIAGDMSGWVGLGDIVRG